jgi:polysaccharide export outer membrane protein
MIYRKFSRCNLNKQMLMRQLVSPLRHAIQPLSGLTLLTLMTIANPEVATAQPLSTEKILASPNTVIIYPETSYTLGAGDRIRVEIFRLPQYSGEQEILVNGSINLPKVGSILLQGLTLEQAAAAIAAKYNSARILREPLVTVSLLTPRPIRIGIAGEINRPGSYTIPIEGSRLPTLTQVLKLAGGITQAADLRNVQLNRVQQGGSQQAIAVDLWQLVQTGDLNNDLTLRDGDTIYIPTASQINLAEAPQLASASFSVDKTQPINVAVLGEVRQPGTHTIQAEATSGGLPTVTQAIKSAGGINPLADVRQIQIRRLTKTGSEQAITINLWQLLQAGDLQQDLILQNGDTVFVPTVEDLNLAESAKLRSVSFGPDKTQPLNITAIGEVFRPGTYTVTGSARTSEAGIPGGESGAESIPTVTRAIQIAGGIKPLANIRQIQVRRLTSTGTERIIEVDLWKLLQEGDSSQDIILQEGDTIVVPTATALAPEEAAQVAAASFSPNTIAVNIVGEVKNPGVVAIPPNTPLNQALLAAGGFTNRARTGSVELIRLNPNGSVSRREISIDLAQSVNEQTNPVLYNNDMVVVNRSTLAGISDTLDEALNPLGKFLTIFSLPFRLLNFFD